MFAREKVVNFGAPLLLMASIGGIAFLIDRTFILAAQFLVVLGIILFTLLMLYYFVFRQRKEFLNPGLLPGIVFVVCPMVLMLYFLMNYLVSFSYYEEKIPVQGNLKVNLNATEVKFINTNIPNDLINFKAMYPQIWELESTYYHLKVDKGLMGYPVLKKNEFVVE